MQGIHPVFHVSVLRRHHVDIIDQRRRAPPSPVVVNGKEEWEVNKVLDCRRRGKRTEYLVSWKRYGPTDNSWDPEDHLDNSRDALREFNTRHRDAAARHRKQRWQK
jgi:hypothetical protein